MGRFHVDISLAKARPADLGCRLQDCFLGGDGRRDGDLDT